jgi:hypothetical protein
MSKNDERDTQSRQNDEHRKTVGVADKREPHNTKGNPRDDEHKLEAVKIVGNG